MEDRHRPKSQLAKPLVPEVFEGKRYNKAATPGASTAVAVLSNPSPVR